MNKKDVEEFFKSRSRRTEYTVNFDDLYPAGDVVNKKKIENLTNQKKEGSIVNEEEQQNEREIQKEERITERMDWASMVTQHYEKYAHRPRTTTMQYGAGYISDFFDNEVGIKEEKEEKVPEPVDDEEVIINIVELASHYTTLELESSIENFDAEKHQKEYNEAYEKHFNIIKTFKRNNNV